MEPKILIIKIKEEGKKMQVIEAKRKSGWSKKDITKFLKGMQSAHPEAKITYSTIKNEV